MAVQLPSKTRLTDGVRLTLRAEGETLDKALADNSAQVIEVRMGAALVPKREVLWAS